MSLRWGKAHNFRIQCNKNSWGITCNEPLITGSNGKGQVIGLKDSCGDVLFDLVETDKDVHAFRAVFNSEGWIMTDNITVLENGFLEVKRSWDNISHQEKKVVFVFEAITMYEPNFFLIPCVSYNGNRWGKGNEPKGLTYNGEPWVFAYDRTGLPSATFSENGEYSVGMFVSNCDRNSLISSCSMERTSKGMMHRILWPDREQPVSYSGRDKYGPAIENTIKLGPGEKFTTLFYISVTSVEEKNTGWMRTYDRAARVLQGNTEVLFQPDKVWELGISYARDVLLCNSGDTALFNIGLLPEEKFGVDGSKEFEWKLRDAWSYEIGWCGQNASLACALIYDYILNGCKESLMAGIRVLDSWEGNARKSNGLFHVQFDAILAGEKDAAADTCNLGWGAWQMMNAYELVKSINIDKPLWLDMGLKLCDFFTDKFNGEVLFGKTWSLDGICIDMGGTIGCFVLIPLIKAFEITRDTKYLDCAVDAFKGYVERDLNNMECTAGALDTSCVDKETCWPLLKAALDLYEITGEDFYIKSALKAGYYLLSWMYHYDVVCGNDCDFNRYGYHTYGATSVSTQHHHLDPWGALICLDWLRLCRHTGDKRWKARALATWNNSLLCLSDGNLDIHGMKRPAGSQNEAYFHCRWNFFGDANAAKGSLNDWLVSWMGAFRLVTLMREKDWDVFCQF